MGNKTKETIPHCRENYKNL